MQRLFLLCLLLLGIQNNVTAQDCNITFKGKITDYHDKTPIVGATIAVLNLNRYTTSNTSGNFEINKLCKGKITIEIKHISCETKYLTFNLEKNVTKEIYLEHHLEELNEVIVKTNTKTEKTSIEKTIKREVISQFSDKSLGDALNIVSGVSSLNTGNAIVKPMIHGLHSSRLLIINNNVRLFDQEWGDEHAPNIDINASNSIAIIKGANTLRYGSDAIGGLILLKPQKFAAKDSLFGKSTIALNSNGFGGNFNTEIVKTHKSGFYKKLQLSYKQFGDFNAADYNLSNTSLRSINASLNFGFKSFEKGFDFYYSIVNNNIGILRAAHVGNVNDLVRAINSGSPSFVGDFSYKIDNPKQEITHHLAKIEAYKRFKGLGKLSLQFDFQYNRRKEFDRRRSVFSDVAAADFKLFTTSLQPNLKIDAFEDLELNTGILVRYQQNISADEAITRIPIPLIPDYKKYELGAYITGNYNLDFNTEISAGFRYDYARINADKIYQAFDWENNNYDVLFPDFTNGVVDNFKIQAFPKFNFHNFSASLGFLKTFDNGLELVFNYGLASRTPNVSELFSDGLHHSAARIEVGNLLIKKEVANKFVASFGLDNENFGFSVSPYYKYIDNFIQLIPSGEANTTLRGSFLKWEYNQTNARIFGVDIDINKKLLNSLNYKGNLSLLRGDNITLNIPLINMPSTNFSNAIVYKNEKLNQLSIGISQRTEFRQGRFPNYNFTTFNPIIQEDVLVDISTPTDAFTLLNFNSAINFKLFKKYDANLAFSIENVLNTTYRNYLNRLRYFADDLGRNYNLKLNINY